MIYLTPLQASPEDDRDYPYVPVAAYPVNFQMRGLVGDVEDQKSTGSCTANSVVSACEIHLQKAGTFRHLSRLFNYYVTRELEGRLGQSGAVLRNAVKQAAKLGLPNEDVWAYDESKVDTAPSPAVYAQAQMHKVLRYERIQGATDTETVHAIKSALSEGYPVVFGMPVTQQWLNMLGGDTSYRGVTDKDPAVGAHAMTLIGYSLDFFVVENSWGAGWGDAGLGYIPVTQVGSFFEAWVIRGFDVDALPMPAPVVPVPAPVEPPAPKKDSGQGTALILLAIVVVLVLIFTQGK